MQIDFRKVTAGLRAASVRTGRSAAAVSADGHIMTASGRGMARLEPVEPAELLVEFLNVRFDQEHASEIEEFFFKFGIPIKCAGWANLSDPDDQTNQTESELSALVAAGKMDQFARIWQEHLEGLKALDQRYTLQELIELKKSFTWLVAATRAVLYRQQLDDYFGDWFQPTDLLVHLASMAASVSLTLEIDRKANFELPAIRLVLRRNDFI